MLSVQRRVVPVAGAVDFTIPARVEESEDFVRAEFVAGRKGHMRDSA